MLMNDGSLEAAETSAQRRKLEADPLEGADAAGRKTAAPARKKAAPKETPEA